MAVMFFYLMVSEIAMSRDGSKSQPLKQIVGAKSSVRSPSCSGA